MPVSIKRKNSSKPKTMSKYKSSSNSKKHLIKSSKYGSKTRKMSGGSFRKLFRSKDSKGSKSKSSNSIKSINSGSVKSRSGSSDSSSSVKSRSGNSGRYSMSGSKPFVIEIPQHYKVTYGKDTMIEPGLLSSNPSLLVPPEIINVLKRNYPDTHQPLKRPTSVINNSFRYGPHAELINKFYSKKTHDKGEELYRIEFEKNYGYYRTDTERRQAAEKARSEYLKPITDSLIALGYKIIPK